MGRKTGGRRLRSGEESGREGGRVGGRLVKSLCVCYSSQGGKRSIFLFFNEEREKKKEERKRKRKRDSKKGRKPLPSSLKKRRDNITSSEKGRKTIK